MIRRIFNWITAYVLTLLFIVPMMIIAIAIKLTSRGPILFIQERIGYKGRVFRIYKFRTMYDTFYTDQHWTSPDDPRVTSIGKFLRRTRLDELPQLFNVLLGHMNVVGPRPEQPMVAQNLQRELNGYQHRHDTLPGITGLAQVRLPYDRTISDVRRKLAVDMEYIQTQSVLNDLKIMMKTPGVMFRVK